MEDGDRVIEIGAVEIINRVRSGKYFHKYLKVPKESSAGALEVHGLTTEFLSDKPEFSAIKDDFLEFLEDSPLVIHNAKFDVTFLNNEFDLVNVPRLSCKIVDTLIIARQKFPGSPANLDALCRKFNIDSSKRVKHGALLDAELLADVYLELTGGSQISFDLQKDIVSNDDEIVDKVDFPHRVFSISEEESMLHHRMLDSISDALWKKTGN